MIRFKFHNHPNVIERASDLFFKKNTFLVLLDLGLKMVLLALTVVGS